LRVLPRRFTAMTKDGYGPIPYSAGRIVHRFVTWKLSVINPRIDHGLTRMATELLRVVSFWQFALRSSHSEGCGCLATLTVRSDRDG